MSESTAALLQTVREGLQALAEELAAGKGERLQAVLDFAGRFHRYSLNNQALIAAQCPTATYVAGYRAWQRLGHQVRKGERGIRILAPRPYTRTTDAGEEEEHVSFVAVAVFDAGQLTEPPALPTMRTTLPDDQQGRYAAVEAALTTPWSAGPTEGTVCKIKLLKRRGFGRATFGLLRQRVLVS